MPPVAADLTTERWPSSGDRSWPRRAVLEPRRLRTLHASGLLVPGADAALDRWTRRLTAALDVPVGLLSLVDRDRQVLKSRCGLPEPWDSRGETPLSHSFCQYVVALRASLVVQDAREHPRLHDNGAVADLGVVAYAGRPITSITGDVLGALCAIDGRPRAWDDEELALLDDLAAGLQAEVNLREAVRDVEPAFAPLRPGASLTDDLTGLGSFARLEEEAGALLGAGDTAVLVRVVLEGLAGLVSASGRSAADAALVRVATGLRHAVTGTRATAHRVGDGFAVLVPHDATGGASDVVTAVQTMARATATSASLVARTGSVALPWETASVSEALRAAEPAMLSWRT